MKECIITEEQLERISKRGSDSAHCIGIFREVIAKEVRSQPYNPQEGREKMLKVLDELEQWSWDNRRMFFCNNAYNPLILKLEELRKGGE